MAVPAGLPLTQIVELTELSATQLDPLLAEEITIWRDRFRWDFRPSADLLRRFLQIRALYGCALLVNGEIAGYSYFVCEGRKALIGDFYVRRAYTSPSVDLQLLQAVVGAILRTSGIHRIESQLMMYGGPSGEPPSVGRKASRYDRFFMEIDQIVPPLPDSGARVPVHYLAWNERFMEEMAHLLAACYRGHIDSELNDQYRNVPGARQFLSNIIRFPGCGRFSPEASFLALDAGTGRLVGMCLASRVSENSGHITQLCVLPALRGQRLGYELIRRCLQKLADAGLTNASLTVTCTNVDAVRLYRALGFQVGATFPALVWDRA